MKKYCLNAFNTIVNPSKNTLTLSSFTYFFNCLLIYSIFRTSNREFVHLTQQIIKNSGAGIWVTQNNIEVVRVHSYFSHSNISSVSVEVTKQGVINTWATCNNINSDGISRNKLYEVFIFLTIDLLISCLWWSAANFLDITNYLVAFDWQQSSYFA